MTTWPHVLLSFCVFCQWVSVFAGDRRNIVSRICCCRCQQWKISSTLGHCS